MACENTAVLHSLFGNFQMLLVDLPQYLMITQYFYNTCLQCFCLLPTKTSLLLSGLWHIVTMKYGDILLPVHMKIIKFALFALIFKVFNVYNVNKGTRVFVVI